jgi:choline dehydrogenase-like flavoprotein
MRHELDRRRLLMLLAGSALTGSAFARRAVAQSRPARISAASGPQPGKGLKIVVIGAGMAGLSAAATLVEAGAEVVVVEARDRIGGRIFTDRSLGVPVEHGAAFIHGYNGNPVAELAAEAGATPRRAAGSRRISKPTTSSTTWSASTKKPPRKPRATRRSRCSMPSRCSIPRS